jgi:hypothetical protein
MVENMESRRGDYGADGQPMTFGQYWSDIHGEKLLPCMGRYYYRGARDLHSLVLTYQWKDLVSSALAHTAKV